MSQLIQIRQRIKAIQTIKKITHAMRLISMSMHSRLKNRELPLKAYTHAIHDLFNTLSATYPLWKSPILQPNNHEYQKNLIIIVSSQKGLCGSFNSALFTLVRKEIATYAPNTHYILIGKKAIGFGKELPHGSVIQTFSSFTNSTRTEIARQVAQLITAEQQPYTQVTIISNMLKTFFQQKPTVTTLIPVTQQTGTINPDISDYRWEQEPDTLLNYLSNLYIITIIEHAFFQSLFAEHAARFISMDTATRNAETILEATKLTYNKLRQTKITKELTELSGSNL